MGKTDIGIAQSRGDAVIALLERSRIAPLPAFYTVLYDYVAGVGSLEAARAGGIVESAGSGVEAGELLYEEFVRPYEPDEAFDRAIAQMVDRLRTLDIVLAERSDAARQQSAELADASVHMGQGADIDARLLRDLIGRLKVVNDRARKANTRLAEEVERARGDLAAMNTELQRLSRDTLIDPLTGVANRRGLDQAIARLMTEARDSGTLLSVAVLDVDRLKKLNDSYGHQLGGEILRLVARAMLAGVRTVDVVGRLGGDEFVAIMPDCSAEDLVARAEAIRTTVCGTDLAGIPGNDILGGVTVSIGVATCREGETITALLDRADRCLLAAKSRGRNCVVAEPAAVGRAQVA